MTKIAAVFTFIAASVMLGSPAQAQILGMNGIWTLNQELSFPKAQCEYLHYTITADEQHYIVDEITSNGQKFNTEYRAKYDGQEYPNRNLVTGEVNYIKLRKVLDRVEQVTNIRREKGPDGKEVSVVRGYYIRMLSPDGKQITSTLLDGNGQVTGVRVFDRVEGNAKPKC